MKKLIITMLTIGFIAPLSAMEAPAEMIIQNVPHQEKGENRSRLELLDINMQEEVIRNVARYKGPENVPLAEKDAIKNLRTWSSDPNHPYYARLKTPGMTLMILHELSPNFNEPNLFKIAAALRTPGVQEWITSLSKTLEGQQELRDAVTDLAVHRKSEDVPTINFILDSIPNDTSPLLGNIVRYAVRNGHPDIIKRLIGNQKMSPNYLIGSNPLLHFFLEDIFLLSNEQLAIVKMLLTLVRILMLR